jgi:hypothetical protein
MRRLNFLPTDPPGNRRPALTLLEQIQIEGRCSIDRDGRGRDDDARQVLLEEKGVGKDERLVRR